MRNFQSGQLNFCVLNKDTGKMKEKLFVNTRINLNNLECLFYDFLSYYFLFAGEMYDLRNIEKAVELT